MSLTPNSVAVPAQSKSLDTATVTTAAGLVHRQVISLADPENQGQYARLTGSSLQVAVTNTSLAVTAAALPLPSGAATAALQTTANANLAAIEDSVKGQVIAALSTATALNTGVTFTSAAEDAVAHSTLVVACKTDQVGMLYIDFSTDATNWDSSLSFKVAANINEVHRVSVTRQYARVRLTNTSASNQTYLRLQTLAGNQQPFSSPLNLQIQNDADTIVVRPTDFNLLVTEGLYENRKVTIKEGTNSDIDTGSVPEDASNEGGVYAGFPAAAASAEIVVAGADTGTVWYSYLASETDLEYTFASKAITGAGTYALGHDIWRCNYAYFTTNATSSTANVGAITIRHTATPANVFCVISTGYGQTFCAAYTVPFGSKIYLDRIQGNLRGSTSGSIEGYIWYRQLGNSPLLRFPFELQFGQLYFDDIDYLVEIPGQVDIIPRFVSASVSNLSAKVSYRFIKVRG